MDLHRIEGFVSVIDLEAKCIISVWRLCAKRKKVLLEHVSIAERVWDGVECVSVCVCA